MQELRELLKKIGYDDSYIDEAIENGASDYFTYFDLLEIMGELGQMTETQKQQRKEALTRSFGQCAVCGDLLGNTPQYAHRIANTKANRDKFGALVIDHTLNGEYVCSLRCNDALNIGNNPAECFNLIEKIIKHEKQRRGL